MNKKYICISIQSTSQFKYWNHDNGWETLITRINSIFDYDVYVIDKYKSFGTSEKMNYIPTNAIDKTGLPIEKTIKLLKNAEMFIGISSGLSWLAWSIGVPVILISGFTPPFFEFSSGCERIFNPNVCNSCFCDINIEFDKSDWMFCPRHKNTDRQFECSKLITTDMVMNAVGKLISLNRN